LQLGSDNHFGFFDLSALHFTTQSVTIPIDAAAELTLSAPFTMTGSFSFREVGTGFTFASGIFGEGLANISMTFSPISKQYEIRSVRYDFQPATVPEPTTIALLGAGLAGVSARRYQRRRVRKS
jgi:hypothetical protein